MATRVSSVPQSVRLYVRLQPNRLLCSYGFSRQEYWIGLPFPSPGDLPNPGIKPTSPIVVAGFFTTEPPGSPYPPPLSPSPSNNCSYSAVVRRTSGPILISSSQQPLLPSGIFLLPGSRDFTHLSFLFPLTPTPAYLIWNFSPHLPPQSPKHMTYS